MNEIKTFYDLTAEQTADEWYANDILNSSVLDFVKRLPKHPKVLDLGCGPGHESMRLAGAGADVVGVDFSEECIKAARERCPGVIFEVLDFRELDQRFGTFDGVWACASLIHIEPEALPDVLRRTAAVLKRNGYLIVMVMTGEGILEEKSNLEVDGRKLRRTVYGYTRESFTAIAEKAGFDFVSEGYLDPSISARGWESYIYHIKEG
jgi:2-polyprenyl-3-methyl-5-hydroxy-6-metoxy-1,4-benzoquinol methylase